MNTPRPCICTPDYRCTKHYRIDPRLEAMAKNFAVTDATFRRFLQVTEAGINAFTEHMNTLLNELGPPPGWTPDDTTEEAS